MIWKKWRRWGLALVAILLLAWAGITLRTGLSLWGRLNEARGLAAAPGDASPARACALAVSARGDVVALRRQTGALVRLAPALGWLPRLGGALRAAPHLLEMGDSLSEAGAIACSAFGPALSTSPGTSANGAASLLERVLAAAGEHRGELEQAGVAAARAETAWNSIDASTLPGALAGRADLIDQVLPLLTTGLKAAGFAPDLLGASTARTYLILASNEEELRPAGGYITGVGEVRVQAGKVISMTFRDSNLVDDFSLPYPDPPEPLRRFMGIDLWVLRDTGWSPDFPTVAKQAVALYRPGYKVAVDGVIGVDQHAVQAIVDALAPLPVEGSAALTGENVVAFMHQSWAPSDGQLTDQWWLQRKSFMGQLAGAILQKAESGQVDWTALAGAVMGLLRGKHVMVYLSDQNAAGLLAERGWDGGLTRPQGDGLMVVDANLGYNKANALVREAIGYQVDLSQSPPVGRLTLTYRHTGSGNVSCKPESRYDPVYEQMMNRCYWDYLRVFVPAGSQLVDATHIPIPAEMLWGGIPDSGVPAVSAAAEPGWLSYSTMGLLGPGAEVSRIFTWTLPANALLWQGDAATYTLEVNKQPGTPAWPLAVRIRPPAGMTVAAGTRPSGQEAGGWLAYSDILDGNRKFMVHMRRGN